MRLTLQSQWIPVASILQIVHLAVTTIVLARVHARARVDGADFETCFAERTICPVGTLARLLGSTIREERDAPRSSSAPRAPKRVSIELFLPGASSVAGDIEPQVIVASFLIC